MGQAISDTPTKGRAKHPHNPDRPEPVAVRRALEKGDMKALALALSVRQRRFAEEYIIDFNGAAAAIRAGYSPKWVDRQAHTLSQHKGVSAYTDHLARKKADSIVSVSPDYVIQKVTAIITKEGVSDSNALRALELIARHLGMFVDRTEITGKDGGPIATQQIEEEARSFTDQLRLLREKAEAETAEKTDVVLV